MPQNSYSPDDASTSDTSPTNAVDAGYDDEGMPVRELGDVPAIEVITKAIVMLMSASAEKLGLADGASDEDVDLDEARRLITALAGLVHSSTEYLGIHAAPVRDGLKSLQAAFREASAEPDAPGEGPGEKVGRSRRS
ncbi:hypothetical protein GCM10027169_21690 [Gordonia jinhuaensis]|uniref:Recombinase RecA n=1 Tax=Gordonia jinhuaensis TaxID=1517702 RepID=A0A916WZF1_9ACTN|nr:DUF1844 domain-containing protein [Gordonia jinhuaensis]GGB42653.1 hypothetical protein GCM10011489_32700 [Gordonia jinhuaensis]